METIAGRRQQVADASPAAIAKGIDCGMTLAEARILCPGLVSVEHDPAADRRALEALARWLIRFTPDIAVGWMDALTDEEPAVLFLDITGCERLFGGVGNILRQVTASLVRFGLPANVAIAPTPGAAWALALTKDVSNRVIEDHQLLAALAPLPLESLRIGPDIAAALRHLGLRTIGQVLNLPREELPSRFGPLLLTRLDQALGHQPEPLLWLGSDEPVEATMEFDAPIEALESIWLVVERLLDRILIDLARRGAGVRQLELLFRPDRGAKHPPITRTIPLSRPTRDRRILLDLLRRTTEQLDCDGGFCSFDLKVSRHERIFDTQSSIFGETEAASQTALDRLFERLCVTFGQDVVVRPERFESYLPERAWRVSDEQVRSRRDTPGGDPPNSNLAVRPFHLLPTPAEIRVVCEPSDEQIGNPRQFTWNGRVHRLSHAIGPERINGEWWRGHHRTRDYYDVQDDQGLRFWIFRVVRQTNLVCSTRWFLHGRFV